jgi:hypothetical protein
MKHIYTLYAVSQIPIYGTQKDGKPNKLLIKSAHEKLCIQLILVMREPNGQSRDTCNIRHKTQIEERKKYAENLKDD